MKASLHADRTIVLAARILIASLLCAILYLGRAVFIPLAMSALFGFMLHPVVRRLLRFKLPRALAVAITVTSATALLGAASWLIAGQLSSFTRELPDYQRNISAKIGQAQALLRGGTLEKLQETIQNVAQEAKLRGAESKVAPPTESRPMPVVIGKAQYHQDIIGELKKLATTKVIEVGVGLALETKLGVPVGLAVTHEIDQRGHRRRPDFKRSGKSCDQSLTVEMSGASTDFMPTT